jgi:hypothetical protein
MDHSVDAVTHQLHIPIQKISEAATSQAQIGQELGFMDRQDLLHHLVFHDD